MKILLFGNGKKYDYELNKKIASHFAQRNEVTLISNKRRTRNINIVHPLEKFNIIYIDYNDYNYDKLFVEQNFDVVLGLDETVAPFVADYKIRTKIKSYCFFKYFPSEVINGKDLKQYNFDMSQFFHYLLVCSLELDGIIFNNTIAQEEYYKRYRKDSILIPFSSVSKDIPLFFPKPQDNSEKYIFRCCSLEKNSGTRLFLYVLSYTNYSYHHMCYNFNELYLKKIKKISSEIKNIIKIRFNSSEDILYAEIMGSKFLVSPQIMNWKYDNCILEGMAFEKTGLVSDININKEIFGDSVLYFNSKNIDDFRKKLKILCDDEDVRKEKEKKAKKMFVSKYNLENMIKKIEEKINE